VDGVRASPRLACGRRLSPGKSGGSEKLRLGTTSRRFEFRDGNPGRLGCRGRCAIGGRADLLEKRTNVATDSLLFAGRPSSTRSAPRDSSQDKEIGVPTGVPRGGSLIWRDGYCSERILAKPIREIPGDGTIKQSGGDQPIMNPKKQPTFRECGPGFLLISFRAYRRVERGGREAMGNGRQ
jgi:hypothetical protein